MVLYKGSLQFSSIQLCNQYMFYYILTQHRTDTCFLVVYVILIYSVLLQARADTISSAGYFRLL